MERYENDRTYYYAVSCPSCSIHRRGSQLTPYNRHTNCRLQIRRHPIHASPGALGSCAANHDRHTFEDMHAHRLTSAAHMPRVGCQSHAFLTTKKRAIVSLYGVLRFNVDCDTLPLKMRRRGAMPSTQRAASGRNGDTELCNCFAYTSPEIRFHGVCFLVCGNMLRNSALSGLIIIYGVSRKPGFANPLLVYVEIKVYD